MEVAASQEISASIGCQADGYSVAGGGFEVAGLGLGILSLVASRPGQDDEYWTVVAKSEDDLRTFSFEPWAACVPSATLGTPRYPFAEVRLDARLKPGGHDQKTVVAQCPAGTQVIGGGFLIPEHVNAVGVVGNEPSPAANGWAVTAKNYSNLESSAIFAEATCIPAQLAHGLLGVHFVEEEALVREGNVDSTCIYGGQPLGGGADVNGTTGAFETMSFSPGGHGYGVFYDSGKPGKNVVRAVVVCGEPTAYLGGLGAAEFNRFCEDEFDDKPGSRAVSEGGALGWKCVWEGGTYAIGGGGAEVCRDAYYRFHAVTPKAAYQNASDPLSWSCFAPPSEALEARGSVRTGAAGPLGSPPGGRDAIRVRGSVRLPRPISLARTRVALRSLLAEPSAGGELVRRRGGRDAAPLVLRPRGTLFRASAPGGPLAVRYAGGRRPRVSIALADQGRRLRFDLLVERGRLVRSRLCRRGGRTQLTTRFAVLRGTRRVADVRLSSFVRCDRLR